MNTSRVWVSTEQINDAFQYQSKSEMKGIYLWGRLSWYPPSGYVANLGNDINQALEMIDALEESKWIDEYTRVIFVEFNVWNANSNLFNMFTLSFEMLPTGAVFHWLALDAINLYRYVGPKGLVNLLAEICLTCFTIVVTVVLCVSLIKGKESIRSLWVIVTIVCLLLFYLSLGMYVYRSILTSALVEEMMNNKGEIGKEFFQLFFKDGNSNLIIQLLYTLIMKKT